MLELRRRVPVAFFAGGDGFALLGTTIDMTSQREQGQPTWQDTQGSRRSVPSLECGTVDASHAYNEAAFRHFLALERRRAQRTGRSLLLLLVDLRAEAGGTWFSPEVESRLLATLATCVREIDFVGWYRTGRTVGAVLAQGVDAPSTDMSRQIGERVAQSLGATLARQVGDRLQVRILQLRSSSQH